MKENYKNFLGGYHEWVRKAQDSRLLYLKGITSFLNDYSGYDTVELKRLTEIERRLYFARNVVSFDDDGVTLNGYDPDAKVVVNVTIDADFLCGNYVLFFDELKKLKNKLDSQAEV